MTSPEKLATPEINHASAETAKVLEHAIGALADILGGWRYIRQSHGDLYGVGWDRCEKSASIAIAALRAEVSRLATGRQTPAPLPGKESRDLLQQAYDALDSMGGFGFTQKASKAMHELHAAITSAKEQTK